MIEIQKLRRFWKSEKWKQAVMEILSQLLGGAGVGTYEEFAALFFMLSFYFLVL